MGNECHEQMRVACGRQILRPGLQPRTKINLQSIINHHKQVSNHAYLSQKSKEPKLKQINDNLVQPKNTDVIPKTNDNFEMIRKQSQSSNLRHVQTVSQSKKQIFQGGIVKSIRDDEAHFYWPDKTVLITKPQESKVVLKVNNQLSFQGQVKDKKASGKGTLILQDGSWYDGEWQNDRPHGKGTHKFPDGSMYEGDFINGQKTGSAKFAFANGSIYNGEFFKGKFNGFGNLKHIDNREYSGQWREGVIHGKGVMIYNSNEKYVGQFSQGKRQGRGTYYYGDGRYWQGQWVSNKQEGVGKYFYNGKIQSGVWRCGHRVESQVDSRHIAKKKQIIYIEQQNK